MINDLIQRFKSVEENLQREIENDQNLLVIQNMDRELVAVHDQILKTSAQNSEDACAQVLFLLDRLHPMEAFPRQSHEMDALRKLLADYLTTDLKGTSKPEVTNLIPETPAKEVSADNVVDQSKARISLIGTDYRFQYTSAENLKFYNRSHGDILGMHTAELIGEMRFKGRAEHFFNKCFSGQSVSYYHSLDVANEDSRIMNCRMHPYHEATGEITGAVVTMIDVTCEITHALDQIKLEAIKPISNGALRGSASG